MSVSEILSWREGVSVEAHPSGVCVHGQTGSYLLPSPPVMAWFSLTPGCTEEDLLASAASESGSRGVARAVHHLRSLLGRGLIVRTVTWAGRRLASFEPVATDFRAWARAIDHRTSLTLSRFAYMRSQDGRVVLESPLSHGRVVLDDSRAAALVHALGAGGNVEGLGARAGLPRAAVERLLGLLAEAGMLGGEDEESLPLAAWEFHDLLFHFRSREGRHDALLGGVFRHAGRFPPPPAGKPPTAHGIELPRPDISALERDDPTFATVLERRRSVREFGAVPITLAQLAEFLFRVGRVQSTRELSLETWAGPISLEFTSRPYPSGGGLYEMEIYPVVRSCNGLSPGVYRYDPFGHRLEHVANPGPAYDGLLEGAALATVSSPESIQVLFVLASRFHRLSWKYASLAYALTLKHVGAIYQTMYLTATAMGLAPCGIGAGNPDLFAQATGKDPYTEASVGEFLLGSLASTK